MAKSSEAVSRKKIIKVHPEKEELTPELMDKIVMLYDKYDGNLTMVCDHLGLDSRKVRNEWLERNQELRDRLYEVLERKTDEILSNLLKRAKTKDGAARLWIMAFKELNQRRYLYRGAKSSLLGTVGKEGGEEEDIGLDNALDEILEAIDGDSKAG